MPIFIKKKTLKLSCLIFKLDDSQILESRSILLVQKIIQSSRICLKQVTSLSILKTVNRFNNKMSIYFVCRNKVTETHVFSTLGGLLCAMFAQFIWKTLTNFAPILISIILFLVSQAEMLFCLEFKCKWYL